MWFVDLPEGVPAPTASITRVRVLRVDPPAPVVQGFNFTGPLPNGLADLGVAFDCRVRVEGSTLFPPRVAVYGARTVQDALRTIAVQVRGLAVVRYQPGIVTVRYLEPLPRTMRRIPAQGRASGWIVAASPVLSGQHALQSHHYRITQPAAVPQQIKQPVKLTPRTPGPDPQTAPMPSRTRYHWIAAHYTGPMDQAIKKLLMPLGWKVDSLGTPKTIPTVALFGPMQPSGMLRAIEQQTKGVATLYYNGKDRVITILYGAVNG